MCDDIETLRDALLIIAGEKQCLDNLMGNADVAREAIAVLDRLDFNFKSQANEIEIADATIDRLKTDRDSLRKALDDRHAADKKAWSAIMRAAGRERGLPDNKEVIAYYVAEVERLEKERDDRPWIEKQQSDIMRKMDIELFGWKCTANEQTNQRILAEADRDSLRAKLDRAKEALAPFAEAEKTMMRSLGKTADDHLYGVYAFDLRRAAAILSELSADAPAQQKQLEK
jgi:DNA repair ATPase RecN